MASVTLPGLEEAIKRFIVQREPALFVLHRKIDGRWEFMLNDEGNEIRHPDVDVVRSKGRALGWSTPTDKIWVGAYRGKSCLDPMYTSI